MIPDQQSIRAMWDTYRLPSNKRIHCDVVGKVALALATKIKERDPHADIHEHALVAAALLHDIDKNIKKLPGERHPDAGVRMLREAGMNEVAEIIRTHPLHMILEKNTAPTTIEQQLLFLADKMTKYTYIGIEKRFELWRKEEYGKEAQAILDASYPKVITLRNEIFGRAGIAEDELIKLIK